MGVGQLAGDVHLEVVVVGDDRVPQVHHGGPLVLIGLRSTTHHREHYTPSVRRVIHGSQAEEWGVTPGAAEPVLAQGPAPPPRSPAGRASRSGWRSPGCAGSPGH